MFSCLLAISLPVVWVVDGRGAVEKIVTRLLLPTGLLWLALVVLVLIAWRRQQRLLAGGAAALCIAMTLIGNGQIAGLIANRLERDYERLNPFSGPPYEALVVLGGGASLGANGNTQLNTAGDRIVLAARLFHAGRARRLICTGQRISSLEPGGVDPGDQALIVLQQLGVPRAAISTSGGTNTAEELRGIADFELRGARVGLVTSAWHMSRALRLAEANGLSLVPVPADFITAATVGSAGFRPGRAILACIPAGEGIATTDKICKERLALLAGR
jgi:uncharacterized SAM-binding protein YcdF (DUF218 family)